MECLKNLAVDEVSIEEMIDEGALEVLGLVLRGAFVAESMQVMIKMVQLNPYNEQIAQAVLLSLCSSVYQQRTGQQMHQNICPERPLGQDDHGQNVRNPKCTRVSLMTRTAAERVLCSRCASTWSLRR